MVPAAVRAALGIHGGDRVQFVIEGSEVRMVSAQSLMFAVWANNRGGDAGNTVVDVRAVRSADADAATAKWARVDSAAAADGRSEDDIKVSLLDRLGLA